MDKKIFLLISLLLIFGASFVWAQTQFGNNSPPLFLKLLSPIFERTAPILGQPVSFDGNRRLSRSLIANRISPFSSQPFSCPSCGPGTEEVDGVCTIIVKRTGVSSGPCYLPKNSSSCFVERPGGENECADADGRPVSCSEDSCGVGPCAKANTPVLASECGCPRGLKPYDYIWTPRFKFGPFGERTMIAVICVPIGWRCPARNE